MPLDRPTKAIHSFLDGGGESGNLIRSIDWSQNPLGPMDGWPQSLRTALSIIIHSKFPMFLFWGPELICFYNDAYRPSLGNNGKHPTAVGQRGEAVWPEIWPSIKPLIDQVLSGGEATWSEDQLLPIYRNGQLEDVYWTFSYSPVNDESGKPGGVFVTCTETTQKVRTIRHLEETRDQLSFAIQAADLGTWDLNPLTNRFVGNARLKEWFCLPPDAEVELSIAVRAIADADRQRVIHAIQYALQPASGGQYDIVCTIVNPQTGQERVVKNKGRAYFNDEGVAYRFAGTTQDITEQIMAHERIERAEQRAQLAIDGAGAGSFFVDLTTDEDSIVYSPSLSRIFTGSELTGLTRNSLVTYILPEDRPIRTEAYKEAAQTGRLKYEARTIWQDGSLHWLRVVGAYSFDKAGTPTGFSGIALDITAERMAQQELEHQVQERTKELSSANQALVRTNHELEQFAYIASHDLQEPLRKIQSFASLLQENRHDDQLSDVYLDKVIKSAQRMSSLIKAVLNYSRLTKPNDQFEQTDLNKVLQNVLIDFDLLIEEKGAIIHYDTLPAIEGVPLQLNQLFTNLIGNALKFSTKNPCIEITSGLLSTEEAAQQPGLNPTRPNIWVSVRDNGIGFEQQYAHQIFALFQRLGNSKEYTGTGIGLALCKKIVDNHGGVITAQSQLGQGTTFTIYLPVSHPLSESV